MHKNIQTVEQSQNGNNEKLKKKLITQNEILKILRSHLKTYQQNYQKKSNEYNQCKLQCIQWAIKYKELINECNRWKVQCDQFKIPTGKLTQQLLVLAKDAVHQSNECYNGLQKLEEEIKTIRNMQNNMDSMTDDIAKQMLENVKNKSESILDRLSQFGKKITECVSNEKQDLRTKFEKKFNESAKQSFKCDICDETFKSNTGLQSHQRFSKNHKQPMTNSKKRTLENDDNTNFPDRKKIKLKSEN